MTAFKTLAIRQYSCEFFSCHRQNYARKFAHTEILNRLLEPICEAKFHNRSNGFRPNRSCETALAQAEKNMQLSKLHFVVDIDIKGFFDNVNHGKLLKQMLTIGNRDKKLISIISAMLKAEVAGIGFPEKGTPQGGIISPLLSNIVLNELDWWISSQWETMPTHYEYAKSIGKKGAASDGGRLWVLKHSFDSQSVPDDLVADRLNSAGYSLAQQIDTDGGTVLLGRATNKNVSQLTKDNIYETIVDIRADMTKAKIPNDGRRYLLVMPDAMSLILKSPEFVSASNLGDEIKSTGAIGKIAGFIVKEWNDTTANLAMLAGHPRFATRVNEWSVPVKVQDLAESGKYIGACAVQGHMVYAHKVLRSAAIRAVYSPGSLTVSLAPGTA